MKRMTSITKSVVIATLFFCLGLSGCGSKPTPAKDTVSFEGGIMGTTYHITVVSSLNDDESAAMAQAIESGLKHVDRTMSTYKADSELSLLNSAPGGSYHALSEETFAMLQLALQINGETEGAFDITVGPLVNAWGFGPGTLDAPPSEADQEALRKLVGPDKIGLDEITHSVKKAADEVYCDLSGIAKGYAVDVVAEILIDRGLESFMVEVGGEVRAAGLNGDEAPWKIAIEKPVTEERVIQDIVGLRDMSLATSGNYRNFYEIDGKRVSHTIDPVNGKPVDHSTASVSVLHTRCALADAYATALMVLGPERGLKVAERLQLPVMFLVHGENGTFITKQTESFKQFIVQR